MITTVKSYAELCLEIQQLREENKRLKGSSRMKLLMEVVQENIELEEENKHLKLCVALLEARVNRNAKGIHY